jgi:hypothetical protein
VIAVPIAAHHGALPVSTGERFADMIGAMTPPPPTPPSGPPITPSDIPAAEGGSAQVNDNGLPRDTSVWTLDDWKTVLFSMPPTVMSDLLASQGMPVDATVATIPTGLPGSEPFVMPTDEEHRGSTGTGGDGETPVSVQQST